MTVPRGKRYVWEVQDLYKSASGTLLFTSAQAAAKWYEANPDHKQLGAGRDSYTSIEQFRFVTDLELELVLNMRDEQ